jgi:hypothetical protein
MKQEDKDILRKYLPEEAVDQVSDDIVRYKIAFRISRARSTKLVITVLQHKVWRTGYRSTTT